MLVLRYRDFEVNQTIAAHLAILDRQDCDVVWWGWWKKGHEAYPTTLLDALKRRLRVDGRAVIGLVERTSGAYFAATCRAIATSNGRKMRSPDPLCTPEYYRDAKFPAWFAFEQIVAQSRIEWEAQFGRVPGGDETIYDVQRPLPDVDAEVIEAEVQGRSGLVLHISDLHFGKDHGFRAGRTATLASTLLERVTEALPERPMCVVVSGDLSTQSDDRALMQGRLFIEKLADAFELPREAIVIAPGNHDIPIDDPEVTRDFSNEQPFRDQMALFYGRAVSNERVHDIRDANGRHLIMGVLNSSRPRHKATMDYGYVGVDRSEPVMKAMKQLRSRPRGAVWSALVLHHHVLSAAIVEEPERERPVSLALDAGELITLAQRNGVDAILHGHQHMPFVGQVQRLAEFSAEGARAECGRPVTVLGAGSAGSSVADERIPQEVNTNSLSYYEPFTDDGLVVSCSSFLPRVKPRVVWRMSVK